MQGTSRPAWGCLDARELREAAAGHGDASIREHLAGCDPCAQAVSELRASLGRATRHFRPAYRRSLLARPAFWLLLIALGLGGYGVMLFMKRKPPPPPAPAEATTEPAPAPAKRAPARRARPRRTGGSPAEAAIVDVIRKNQTGVRMCYERALKRDPSLSLQVEVRVNVSAGGVVDRVALDGLADGALLANCIRNTIKTWQFPRATAGYEAEFPLRLQAREF